MPHSAERAQQKLMSQACAKVWQATYIVMSSTALSVTTPHWAHVCSALIHVLLCRASGWSEIYCMTAAPAWGSAGPVCLCV